MVWRYAIEKSIPNSTEKRDVIVMDDGVTLITGLLCFPSLLLFHLSIPCRLIKILISIVIMKIEIVISVKRDFA